MGRQKERETAVIVILNIFGWLCIAGGAYAAWFDAPGLGRLLGVDTLYVGVAYMFVGFIAAVFWFALARMLTLLKEAVAERHEQAEAVKQIERDMSTALERVKTRLDALESR